MRWETFEYELACAELCGKGHYSMRKIVKVVDESEYRQWLSNQQSYYKSQVRGTDNDPNKGEVLGYEIEDRRIGFNEAAEAALNATVDSMRTVQLEYVTFETGSANLTANSKYELENLVNFMKKYSDVSVELAGHTDSTGNPESNISLSQARAEAVYNYLSQNGVSGSRLRAVGYGSVRPVDSYETEEGRANNRRTEFTVLRTEGDV